MPAVSFAGFRRTAEGYLTTYLTEIAVRQSSGSLTPPKGYTYLFPTILIFTKTPTHYTVEAFGARRRFAGLRSQRHESPSFNLLLGDFLYEGPTAYIVEFNDGRGPRIISNAALTGERTLNALDGRFPGVRDLYPTQILRVIDDDIQCIKSIDGSRLNGELLLSDCLITNSLNSLVRARFTNLFFAISANIEPAELSEALCEAIRPRPGEVPGVLLVREGFQENVTQAGQFANLYLQRAQETTLTTFLQEHSDLIRRALRASTISFQPDLLWYEGNPDPDEEAIQPDIILRREDGTWLIIDFKLPLLNKGSITTGGHRRRRFTYTVADGIAQLHNYREFFDYAANRRGANARLGGEVIDPQLMLVVGTSENVDLTEVREAMRALKPIDIVDYDTLIHLAVAT